MKLILFIGLLNSFDGLKKDWRTVAPICRKFDEFMEIEKRNVGSYDKIWSECDKSKECIKARDIADNYFEYCDGDL